MGSNPIVSAKITKERKMTYIKPTAAYKMSSEAKIMLSNTLDPKRRRVLKEILIQSELAQLAAKSNRKPLTGNGD